MMRVSDQLCLIAELLVALGAGLFAGPARAQLIVGIAVMQ